MKRLTMIKIQSFLVALQIALFGILSSGALTGCATMHVMNKAEHTYYKNGKWRGPYPAYKILYIGTVPFDLITSPYQIYWFGKQWEPQ